MAAKEGQSKIPGGPESIRKNLSIEAYSARDRSYHDQESLVRGKVGYGSGSWVRDCAATVWLGIYRRT